MDRHPRSRRFPDLVGCTRVVAVGEENPRHAFGNQPVQHRLGRLDRVDHQVSPCAWDEVTVEVVTEPLREPRPRPYPGDDLSHAAYLTSSYSWRMASTGSRREARHAG